MADTTTTNKRNSIAGKIATPKASPGSANTPTTSSPATATQALPDPVESLAKSIGARVRVTAVAPVSQTYEGTIYTICPATNMVYINTRETDTGVGDFVLIPMTRIQSFTILSLAGESGAATFADAKPAIGPVDLKKVKQREQARIAELKEEERSRGKGVTKEAQAIFDALKKINLPIRWHNQEMIVHEAVIIAPPYRPEDCKGAKDKQETLNRVKKVLEGERRKLKEREEKERKVATPAGPRKGG